MERALELAKLALFVSSPNPRVGCLIVSPSNVVLGEGFTQQAGGPHAEVVALRDALSKGRDVQGSTAYVTLEPCAHQGRTGPCCDALVAAGIAKVVASIQDPNPLVGGQGFARLRAAGVEVEVGARAAESRELNIGFFSRMIRGVPWTRLKTASSLDGVTALFNGASQWITSPEARADGHAWRAQACTVLTGVGTVLADDPRLDVREVATPRLPKVAVVDSRLQTPPNARIFSADRTCIIYGAGEVDSKMTQRRVTLEARGAAVIHLPDGNGRVHLPSVLKNLAACGTNELHVEAGARLNGALLEKGLVDEMLMYLSPKVLGPGRGLAKLGVLDALSDAHLFEFLSTERIGPDLRMLARALGRDHF